MRLSTPALVSIAALSIAATGFAHAATTHSSRPYTPQLIANKGFRQTAAAYSSRYQVPLAPGVDMQGLQSAALGASVNSNVVTVDLTHPGVETEVLMNGVTGRRSVQDLARDAGAVAAVNGDFYDIAGSGAAEGAIVRAGKIIKGRRGGTTISGVGTDGVARQALVRLDATVTWGTSSHEVEVLNSDLDMRTLPRDSIEVLDGGWGPGPIAFGNAPGNTAVVAVDSHGTVIATSRGIHGQRVPAHGMLVLGTGKWASLAKLPHGSHMGHHTAMTTDAATPWQWGLAGGLQLVRNGEAVHNYPNDSDSHVARTAMGWKNGGHTLVLVTADRDGGSVGEGVNQMADEMVAQGLDTAIMLDGGGSTTLVARPRAADGSSQVGSVEDGAERHVSTGIGVLVPRGSGKLLDLSVTLDSSTVFTGLHRRATFTGWDEWYGPAAVDPAAVALTGDTPNAVSQSGSGLLQGLTPGQVNVEATAPASAPGAPGPANGAAFLTVAGQVTSLSAAPMVRLGPGGTTTLHVTGSDGTVSAPVDAIDLTRSTDPSFDTDVLPNGDLKITAHSDASGTSPLTVSVGGATATVAVVIAYTEVSLVHPGLAGALRVSNGKGKIVSAQGRRGLRVEPGKGDAATVTLANPAVLPPSTAQIAVDVIGDGRPHDVTLVFNGGQRVDLGVVSSKGIRRLQVHVPPGAGTILALRVVRANGKKGGYLVITGIRALV